MKAECDIVGVKSWSLAKMLTKGDIFFFLKKTAYFKFSFITD